MSEALPSNPPPNVSKSRGPLAHEPECIIVCRNSQGAEIRSTPLRMSRFMVVFEVYNPYSILQLSEVLSEFTILMNNRPAYSGKAVVSNILNAGLMLICEATLYEDWHDIDLFSVQNTSKLQAEFESFHAEWQKNQVLAPEVKVAVADLQSMLVDFRRWMEQVELTVHAQPANRQEYHEREILLALKQRVNTSLSPLFEQFEEACRNIDESTRSAHSIYIRRQIHPVALSSPFFYRSFNKPLGYAGDYEMVNMMIRDPLQGGSMFAKSLNAFFLETPPVAAHRNRIQMMTQVIEKETERVTAQGQSIKILNLGCGPAQEIQQFLEQSELSDHAEFLLLDFNEETLQHVEQTLQRIQKEHQRKTRFQFTLKSVHQLLKTRSGASSPLTGHQYDLIYCAGLFDYLSERICKRLMDLFYEQLAPGGLLLATNVERSNPSRGWMELAVEWHLTYRNQKELLELTPSRADRSRTSVEREATGVNVFLKVRKASHA